MIPSPQPGSPSDRLRHASLRALLRRDGRAMLAGGLATIALTCGVYVLGRATGRSPTYSALAALATIVLWAALAAPVLAASGSTWLASLLRGGIVADASAVTLVVLWLSAGTGDGPSVPFLAAVEIYCIVVAMALAAVAAVRCARSARGRYALAFLAAAVMLAALATPMWIGGMLTVGESHTRQDIAAAAVYVNPFYATTAAVAARTGFVWHHAGIMYGITRIGDYAAPPPVRWYDAVVFYGAATIMLAAAAIARHRPWKGRKKPTD